MRLRLLLSAVVVCLFAAGPATAQIGPSDGSGGGDMISPEDVVVELPVLGTTLTVTISTDATTGDISADVSAAEGDVDGAALAAGFTVHIDSEGNGYEVSLENHDAGVEAEIEVLVGDDGTSTAAEVEVEGYTPGAIAGTANWTGDPIGLGLHTATINYTVTVDPVTNEPTLTINSVEVSDTSLLWSLPDPITHFEADEMEYGLQQSVWFDYYDGTDWVQTSVIFMVEVEHGESELEIIVDNPFTQSKADHDDDHDEDDDDDHDDDDHDDDDHDDDDDDDHDDHDDHDEDDEDDEDD